jgi:hypothetical protein
VLVFILKQGQKRIRDEDCPRWMLWAFFDHLCSSSKDPFLSRSYHAYPVSRISDM